MMTFDWKFSVGVVLDFVYSRMTFFRFLLLLVKLIVFDFRTGVSS